ncbi:MAG: substrate-binding domain-containing protein [Hespellia sp.]|nr:substrate-binding domain-containing protein [Hespellia sp.]
MYRRGLKKTLILLLACTFAVTGCGRQETQAEEKKGIIDKPQIGITFDTFVLERWLKDRDVFVATAQKLGAEVDVQNANGDINKQTAQINRFVEAKVDVIVVIPVDCYELKGAVENARNHGIEVISYDRLIQETKTDLYITVDSEQVGEAMGETMKTNLPDGGNIAMICGPENDTNCKQVADGFEKAIEGSGLNVIYKNYVKAWTSEYGTKAMQEAMAENEQIDGVMCGNDGLAGFAIQVLSEQQLAGQVVVVGQDADLEACQRVVEGTQAMTVYKPIEELARTAAEFAVELSDKGRLPKVKDTIENEIDEVPEEVPYYGLAPVAVTKENMDEVIVDSGFHLHDEVYLNVE